ncbi:hypothetical protein AB2B41_16295 [Marimonas sp. MJW-29]|uniref:Uncharacterized protein n=1 Tax=Sulfitobacter sediminis TaxID=3234186 RepID=A0ABV3RQA5_9RHOB
MSILLLTNPFAQPTQPSSSQPTEGSGTTAVLGLQEPEAVTPSEETNTRNDSGSSTSNSGGGAGAGGEASQAPIRSTRTNFSRAPDAAPISVVNAQVTDRDPLAAPPEEFARQTAIGLMERQRKLDLIDGLKKAPEVVELNPQKEASPMPDPLPTSPFLKRTGS